VGGIKELVRAALHFLVDAQGVLQVVSSAGEVRILFYSPEGSWREFIRCDGCKSIFGKRVMSTDDIVFEAGRRSICVGPREDILGFYPGNEAGVAWHGLVANFVRGAHEPGLARFTLVADHKISLGLLDLGIDSGAVVLLVAT